MSCVIAARKLLPALIVLLGAGISAAAPASAQIRDAGPEAVEPLGDTPPGFSPELRLGPFGTVPALVFNSAGHGHLIYRRARAVHYRYFNGQFWSEERQVNNDESRAEAEFLDRNQPKIVLEPESGAAWAVWGGDIREADKNIYMRGLTPDGQFATEIRKYRIQAHPDLNPEDVAIAFDTARKRIHLYSTHVGAESTDPRNGHYDFTLASGLEVASVVQLGPPQKNIFGFSGPQRAYAFARLHQFRFYQSTGGTAYNEFALHPELPVGDIGAFRFVTLDDEIVHFGIVSTFPPQFVQRDIIYYRFSTVNESDVAEVRVEGNFESPYGLAQPAVTEKGNIFIVYDKKRPGQGNRPGVPAPAFAYRLQGADKEDPFTAPKFFPDYPTDGDAHAPAAAAVGERVYIVWGDKLRDGVYVRPFDFEVQVTPTPTFTATPTHTPTQTATHTPTPTATPRLVAPGTPEVHHFNVRAADAVVELVFRIMSPPVPETCDITIEAAPPTEPAVTFPMTMTQQTQILRDPEPGAWTITVASGSNCPEFAYYLTYRATPPVSAGSGALLAASLLGAATLVKRRRKPDRSRQSLR